MITGAIADTSVTLDHLLVDGEQSIFLATFRGTHGKSDTKVEMRFSGHAIIRNGKIVEATNVLDWLTLMQQLGTAEQDAIAKTLG